MTSKDITWSVSHCLSFTLQIQMNTLFQSFQLVDKWVWQVSLISRSMANVFICLFKVSFFFPFLWHLRHINVPMSSIISQTNLITLVMYINTPEKYMYLCALFYKIFAPKLQKNFIIILLEVFSTII